MAEDKNGNEMKWSGMSFGRKVRNVLENVSVEPVVFFHIVPVVFAGLATQNLNLEKACRVNLNYSDEVCSALTSRQTEGLKVEEKNVQKLVASMAVWTTPLRSSIPALLVMFLGSWSDRKKRRKPFMLLPIVGEFISCVGLLICVYYFYELPMEVAGFFESFFPAITGGWITMFMAVFSYMADITSLEMRTVRMGVLNLCASVGVPLGTALSGVALKAIGFYGIFSISALMYMFSITYGIFRVKEPPSNTDVNERGATEKSHKESLANGPDTKEHFYVFQFLKEFFDLKHIKETFSVVFKKAAKNRRQRIICLIITQMFIMIALHGEMSLTYLFMRYRFNWDEVKFSMFSTYSVIIHVIGTSFSVGVFSHLLKCDDAVLGALSCVSKIVSGLVFAFAQHEWQVYLVPLFDILNGSSNIALRSIASKLVPPDELGKLNSVYGACEALTPMLHGPLFAVVYARTMDTLPGAFFLVSGALTLPALFSFCWMYVQHKRFPNEAETPTSRKSSVVEEVKKTPTPDRSVSNSLTTVPLDHVNHKPEGNNEGQFNLGFVENHP